MCGLVKVPGDVRATRMDTYLKYPSGFIEQGLSASLQSWLPRREQGLEP